MTENDIAELVVRLRHWRLVSEFFLAETSEWCALVEQSTDRVLRAAIADRISHLAARLDAAVLQSHSGRPQ